MKKLSIAFAALAGFLFMPLAANAGKSKCSNKNAEPVYTNSSFSAPSSKQDHWICAHKTKFYQTKKSCPKDYSLSGTTCKQTKSATKKCPTGQKVCSSSYCVASLKKCKTSNKKGNASNTCTGSGWKTNGSKCEKTKSATDIKCPAGFFKAKFGPSSGKFYCKTTA